MTLSYFAFVISITKQGIERSLTWPASMQKKQKKAFTYEKSLTPIELVYKTNMAAASLFWNTNMAAVTSCENALL